MNEPLLCDLSVPGRQGVRFPAVDVPTTPLPEKLTRQNLPMPELSEIDVVRHFTRLSQLNYCIDVGMYPLGSCTMKYNPKINEETSRLPGFGLIHPLQPEITVQGAMALMYDLQEWLKEIGGFAGITLQPAAGAHGELTGILIIRAYHESRGDHQRTKVLIPDSAHGTNPATSAMSGLEVIQIPSDERGNVDLAALKAHCNESLAGLMLTNPNTLGLFDENVLEVIRLVHEAGGLVYGDGA
ncbi:MAG: aminomethyl-transferring glycine dehydrogenase subunit GcvPB, partial [Anaerolineales bacterium]|nr:aminomethyl-transferring glycine dehydrogenase subunit GcvPB [Anaerolineales bacterium]